MASLDVIALDTTTPQLRAPAVGDSYHFCRVAEFQDGTALEPGITNVGDLNTGIYFPAADTLGVTAGGVESFRVGAVEVVVNETGANIDTRIEGDTDANLVFVDASTDFVGIGQATPGSKLDVKGTLRLSGSTSGYVGFAPAATAGSVTYTLPSADGTNGQVLTTNGSAVLSWADSDAQGVDGPGSSTDNAVVRWDGTTGQLVQNSNAILTDLGALTLEQGIVVNDSGADSDTRIEGDTDVNLFFIDASTDRIGVGTATPSQKVDIATGNLIFSSTAQRIIGKFDGAWSGRTLFQTSTTNGATRPGLIPNGSSTACSWSFSNSSTDPDNSGTGSMAISSTMVSINSNSEGTGTPLPIYFNLFDQPFSSGGVSVTRMVILNNGRVGIATTSPGSELDVKGTLRLSGSTSGYVGIAPAAAAGSVTYTLPSADGTAGQVLTTNGSAVLAWADSDAQGVDGPASSTDNALARWDGITGQLLQNSNATLTDAGALTLTEGAVINESGADSDTRIEGDTDANLIFVDASTDRVGIGTSTPATKLDVNGTITATAVNTTTLDLTNLEVTNIKAKDGTAAMSIADSSGIVSVIANPVLSAGTANGVLYLNGSKVATSGSAITYNGATFSVDSAALFNDSGADVDFRIESDTDTHCFFLDASANSVGIGTSSPDGKLDVAQAMTNGSTGAFTTPHLALTATTSTDTTGFVGMTMATSDNSNYGFSYGALRSSGGAGDLVWRSHFNSASGTELLRLTGSGNLGLGVTPSAWGSIFKAIQVGTGGSIFGRSSGSQDVLISGANVFWDGSNWKYIANGFATIYEQAVGVHDWQIAASGTAGNTITFTQAMTLDASGNLLVGTTTAVGKMSVNTGDGVINFRNYDDIIGSGTGSLFDFLNSAGNAVSDGGIRATNLALYGSGSTPMLFYTNGTERARLDSSGNLGIGTSSPANKLSINQGSSSTAGLLISGTSSPQLLITETSTPVTGQYVTDTSAAYLGTTTNHPLVLRTNTTERARITAGGYFKASDSGTYRDAAGSYHEFYNTISNNHTLALTSSSASLSQGGGGIFFINSYTSAGTGYVFGGWYSGNTADKEFEFRGDGNGYADGTWNNNGADYAEYFESVTGAALTVGATVVLDGNKVREATESDPVSAIMGVVRPKEPGKASMVVGNTAWNKWANKYLTDDFDRYIMEDHDVVEWTDADGKQHSYESHRIPADVTVPSNAVVKTHDDKGNKFQHYKLNPAYNPDSEYTPREKRDEWIIVGLVGQVKVLKGKPVNDRWIKMRDVSAAVEEWMIR